MRTIIAILLLSAPVSLWAQATGTDQGEVVGMAELPSRAQTALQQQAAGRGLTELRRVQEQGGTAYRAKIAGTNQVIEVSPNGELLTPPAGAAPGGTAPR